MASQPVIVLTGAGGQLGNTLAQLWPQSVLSKDLQLLALASAELDICNSDAIASALAPHDVAVVINAAAYTAVDKAEEEVDRAYAVNETGAANLAQCCQAKGARMIQVSTDFVFDGQANSPYKADANTGPLGVYGASKLAGEQAVLNCLGEQAVVLRTSWLYSPFNSNFVLTMLRLMREKEQLAVVDDQIGSPTSTFSLADCILAFAGRPDLNGVYHCCDGAEISWCDFAREIQARALKLGLLEREIPIAAIPASDYPTPARRPAYSVLDISATLADLDLPRPDWQQNLQKVLGHLAQ
jgi:dTDP-4-dehydrorhamnose reductase